MFSIALAKRSNTAVSLHSAPQSTCTMKVQLSYIGNNCLELSIFQLSIVPPNKEKCDRVKSIAVHLLKHNTITTFASKLSSMLQ